MPSTVPHSWFTIATLSALLLAGGCAAPPVAPPVATPGPGATGLLLGSEAELATAAGAGRLESFWSTRGVSGSFRGAGGLTLRYMVFPQADPAREKGAIVISSGRTETMLKYKEVVHDLWRNGWSVYIHDHRGQGLSAREPAVADAPMKGHVERFDDYVDDLRSFVVTQVAAGRHRDTFLLAHSMGGAISALLLQRDGPPLFRAAAMSSPMLRIKGMAGLPADILSCRIGEGLTQHGHATDYVVGGKGYVSPPFEGNDLTGSRVRYQWVQAQERAHPPTQLGSPTYGWLAQSCEAAQRARSQGERVRTPVLLMQAGGDRIVHNSGGQEFCEGVRKAMPALGCDGQGGGPVVVPGAEHELLIETDDKRDGVLSRALAFFQAHRSR